MTLDPAKAGSAFSDEQNARAYPDGVGASYWHVARKEIIRRRLSVHAPNARDRTPEFRAAGASPPESPAAR